MSRGRLIVVGGGQSGLAAARAGREKGWEPVVLEAGPEPCGVAGWLAGADRRGGLRDRLPAAPAVPALARVLDGSGSPGHEHGVATGVAGVGFLGLEFQRSFSSNTLRGVQRDADYVVGALARQPHGAAVA